MHELSIAQSIVEIVQDTMNGQDGKLTEVAVDIGELVAVVPESLKFCYDVVIENTPFAGSRLIINILPVKARCRNCDTRFDVEDLKFICPACASTDHEMLQGQELKVKHLEVQ